MTALGSLGRLARGANAVLIAGPTASGKSALALNLAEDTGGEIINADSMQVYADLAILSARPTAAETARAPHHLYGFVPARQEFSVGDWLRAVAPVLAMLKAHEKLAIIVGGTGLYLKALTQGLTETPPIPIEVRASVSAIENLHAALAKRDPEMAARLNPSDRPRLQRALEVIEATGRSLLDWRRESGGDALLKPGEWGGLFLDPPREALAARIDARFENMVAAGALDEAAHVRTLGLPRNRGVMKAHGLPHLIDHLDGKLTLAEAVARGQSDTRRYAKRQRTFQRGQLTGFEHIAG